MGGSVMAEENGVTRVKFDLWAVLGFLVVLSGLSMGYLFNAQANSKAERIASDQMLDTRMTKLEAHVGFIIEGINDLKRGQKDVERSLDTHEKSTMAFIRKNREMSK
jgi:hypothetical protein